MKSERTILLVNRIDTTNAPQVEQTLLAQLSDAENCLVVLDADALVYISSAGLRILLHLRKRFPELRIINVRPEVYEVLEMTGFTEMMTVERAYRTVSVEGCEEIGHGANGSVYRLTPDTVVKVYRNPDALEEIRHEREVAKLALVLGIPTAISYEVVRVGSGYGTVFELLNASSFASILSTTPEKLDWCVREYTAMLKKIHSTAVPAGKLPQMKEEGLNWVRCVQGLVPEAAGRKLLAMVEAIPESNFMLHGDYHTKNLELQNGEVLLIDMDTLSVGNPIFELASIYNSFLGYYETDPEAIRSFQGFDIELSKRFWRKFLAAYLETDIEAKLTEVENKARILGYSRLLRRACRRGDDKTEPGRSTVAHWIAELLELLEQTDELVFSRDELVIPARAALLDQVQAFVEQHLGEDCPMKTGMQIALAVEEIFINICSYSYVPGEGPAAIRVRIAEGTVEIVFRDHGVPYNPLTKEDPDVTALAEDRKIGGLGIFLTKQVMNEVNYEYRDGQNVLILRKKLG